VSAWNSAAWSRMRRSRRSQTRALSRGFVFTVRSVAQDPSADTP
jgi:hypothetical protein